MRKIGVELEFSDINTFEAAKQLSNLFHNDFSLWRDSSSNLKKPILNYSLWNFISDSTIKNTDGTYCLKSYIDDSGSIKNIDINSGLYRDRMSGIEAISPATSNYDKLFSDIGIITDLVLSNGGKIDRSLDNALHVHVDASDIGLDQILRMPRKILKVQNSLEKFFTKNGLMVPLFTEEDVVAIESSKDLDELYANYLTKQGFINVNHPWHRYVINLGPWILKDAEEKTIEFRAYSMSQSLEYIKECVFLSIDIFNYLAFDQDIVDLEDRTRYIESIYR
jgi:hypothetical protein